MDKGEATRRLHLYSLNFYRGADSGEGDKTDHINPNLRFAE